MRVAGKGRFKSLKKDEAVAENQLEFRSTSSDDLVAFNDSIKKLGDIVAEERKIRQHSCATTR